MAAPLFVKDASGVAQPLSTEADGSGNLVVVHAPATTVAGVSTPVGPNAPLPVTVAAGAVAVDGSSTIAIGGTAQQLFSGATPPTGYMVQNNSSNPLWVSDVGTAAVGGSSIQVAASGGVFTTPTGYRPPGAVSIYGGTTGQAFAARSW